MLRSSGVCQAEGTTEIVMKRKFRTESQLLFYSAVTERLMIMNLDANEYKYEAQVKVSTSTMDFFLSGFGKRS